MAEIRFLLVVQRVALGVHQGVSATSDSDSGSQASLQARPCEPRADFRLGGIIRQRSKSHSRYHVSPQSAACTPHFESFRCMALHHGNQLHPAYGLSKDRKVRMRNDGICLRSVGVGAAALRCLDDVLAMGRGTPETPLPLTTPRQ